MNDNNIACPKCGAEIPLTEAVSHRVREQLEADFNRRLVESNAALAERENKLAAEKATVDQRAQGLQVEVSKRVLAERDKLFAEARQQADAGPRNRVQGLHDQLRDQRNKLDQAQKAELELLKQTAALETAKQEVELTVARTLDEERQRIADTARVQAMESERLKLPNNAPSSGSGRNASSNSERPSPTLPCSTGRSRESPAARPGRKYGRSPCLQPHKPRVRVIDLKTGFPSV